jgi:uncharacterized iron-regulated membrane protein
MRRLLLTLHLWLGCVAALLFIILGVTGSVMVLEEEIDRALNSNMTWVRPAGSRLPLSHIKAELERSHPGFRVQAFEIPLREDVSWGAFLRSDGSGGLALWYDPYTGKVLGTGRERNNFTGKLHQFHLRLLLGNSGRQIVGWAGPVLLVMAMSGLVLWWPRKITRFRWRTFDLHQAAGIWASAFLLLFALTAIVIRWEEEASKVLNALTGSQAPLRTIPLFPDRDTRPLLDPDQLLEIAAREAPGARPTSLQLGDQEVRIPMRYEEDRTPAGRTNLYLDAHTGYVIDHIDSRSGPLGYRIVKLWNREIHTGDIFGWPTRIIASVASLTLSLLAITGPLIWWNRRRPRIRASGPGSRSLAGGE